MECICQGYTAFIAQNSAVLTRGQLCGFFILKLLHKAIEFKGLVRSQFVAWLHARSFKARTDQMSFSPHLTDAAAAKQFFL